MKTISSSSFSSFTLSSDLILLISSSYLDSLSDFLRFRTACRAFLVPLHSFKHPSILLLALCKVPFIPTYLKSYSILVETTVKPLLLKQAMVKLLNSSGFFVSALRTAIKHGSTGILSELISRYTSSGKPDNTFFSSSSSVQLRSTKDVQALFMLAVKSNQLTSLQILLTAVLQVLDPDNCNSTFRNSFFWESLVCEASKRGHCQIAVFLLHHHILSTFVDGQRLLTWACRCGNMTLFRLLYDSTQQQFLQSLTTANVNENNHNTNSSSTKTTPAISTQPSPSSPPPLPGYICVEFSANHNQAIKDCCCYGHTHLMKLLLEIPAVDPAVENNYPLRIAAKRGFHEIVVLLLGDSRVNPTSLNNKALRNAIANSRVKVIHVLIEDRRVMDSADVFTLKKAQRLVKGRGASREDDHRKD